MNFSYWEQKQFATRRNLIICGAGFTGLSAAVFYKQRYPDRSVLILERDAIAAGASTKNAGFACFGSVSELLADLDHSSETAVFDLVEKRYRGIAHLREFLGDEAIDYKPTQGFELFLDTDAEKYRYCLGSLSYINAQLSSIIGKQVFFCADDKIKEFGFSRVNSLIVNLEEGQVDPGKMYVALLAKAKEAGVEIYNGIAVSGYEESGDELEIQTNRGEFQSDQFLIATNGFAKELVPDLEISPARAQVLITNPLDGLKLNGVFHYDEGYYYFRNIHNRVLLGGARNLDFQSENTTAMGDNAAIQENLEHFLHEVILPGQPVEIDRRWSGIMGMGPQKAVIVEKRSEKIFWAVRFGGMGVALSTLIGREIVEQM